MVAVLRNFGKFGIQEIARTGKVSILQFYDSRVLNSIRGKHAESLTEIRKTRSSSPMLNRLSPVNPLLLIRYAINLEEAYTTFFIVHLSKSVVPTVICFDIEDCSPERKDGSDGSFLEVLRCFISGSGREFAG